MPDGSLSLPARLYLLSWDTERLKVTGATHLHHLVRAGALTELAQRGLLADVEGIATPVDPDARTGISSSTACWNSSRSPGHGSGRRG